jgi:glycosyltransferase involved in cell wall biosynthesis
VDVIHVHDLPLAKVGWKLSHKYRLKFVLDLHENRPEIMRYYNYTNTFPGNILISIKKWENYQKYISTKADRLILVTDIAKKDYVSRYGVKEQKVFAVPNWPDMDVLESFETDPTIIEKYKDKFMFLYFGDTGTRRGTKDIIETAALLKDNPKFHFVIIGNSQEQEQLKKRIENLNLKNVELTGYIPFNKIISYIKASKAGLCPFHKNLHHDTTYANKLFQLMYFGRPIISSNCTAQQIIIEKEKCGYIFTSGDVKILSEKIVELSLLSKKDYDDMGRNGRKAVISKYNLENGHKSLINLYNSL